MSYNIKSLNVILVPITDEEKKDIEDHLSFPDELYEIYKIPGTNKYYMMPEDLKKQAPSSWAAKTEALATEKAYFYNGSSHINYDAVEITDRPVYMVAPTEESYVGGYQLLNLFNTPLASIIDGSFEIIPDGSFVYDYPRN